MNCALITSPDWVPFVIIMAGLWAAVAISVIVNAGAERVFPWLSSGRSEKNVVRFETTLARDGKYVDVVVWVRFEDGVPVKAYAINENGRELRLSDDERAAIEAEARGKL